MTELELVAAAKKLGRWEEVSDVFMANGIRRIAKNGACECPIVAVANDLLPSEADRFDASTLNEASIFLGLDDETFLLVLNAADSDLKFLAACADIDDEQMKEKALRAIWLRLQMEKALLT